MGIASVNYNFITMQNVQTREFSVEPQYDESGSNLLFKRCRYACTVVDYVQPANAATVVLGLPGAGVYNLVTGGLTIPRKGLSITFADGSTIISNKAPDEDNGPKPKVLKLVRFSSALQTFDWEVEFTMPGCDADTRSGALPSVLSNRWSVSDAIDSAVYTTRTYHGYLRVSSVNIDPQAFRGQCMPPLETGFMRDSISVTTTPNGLEMEYQVVDKEVKAAPPSPARRWGGTHTVGTTDSGAKNIGTVNIWLEAERTVEKRDLIATAVSIVTGKLGLGIGNPRPFVTGANIIDHFAENRVEVSAQCVYLGRTVASLLGTPNNVIGKPLDPAWVPGRYDPNKTPVIDAYGTLNTTRMLIAALTNSCSGQKTSMADAKVSTSGAINPGLVTS